MESGTSDKTERNLGARAQDLQDDIQHLTSAGSADVCFHRLCKSLERRGFDIVVTGQAFIMADAGAVNRRFFFHHGIADFLKLYVERNYQFSDPITLRAMTTHRPFRWREAHVDMTRKQIEQIEAAKRHGLNYGIVFPVKDQSGAMGFVSIGRETDFDLSERDFLELELLCRYGYLAIDGFFDRTAEQSDLTLTPRETAILVHVSRGKTNWETGQILGISEYSVRDYLKALSKRLETSNRTHTVVRAIQLGLILP